MSTVPEPGLTGIATEDDEVVAEILAFLPIHKLALGVACGLVGGALLFGVTAFAILVLGGDPPGIAS